MLTTPLRNQPGGTIISSLASPPISHLANNKHGLMAPLRRKKILVCFGCGKKSGIKYDGLIRRWDCTLCDSPNFLDENGDITDPPAETFSQDTANIDRSYAVARDASYLPRRSSRFCENCLKNQHLNNASMRQLDIDLDLSRPGFGREEKALYEAAKERIEKRYPQVCEDCQAGVLEGIRASLKWAKGDDLGRRLAKTRDGMIKKSRSYSISDLGRLLWYAGLWGHVLWSLSSMSTAFDFNVLEGSPLSFVSTIMHLVQPSVRVGASEKWILVSLLCTVSSCWWNPYISKSSTVYRDNINGLRNWYRFQIFTIAARSVAWWLMGTGVAAQSNHPATICAHLSLVIVNLFLARAAYVSLSIEVKPLWGSTPTSFKYVAARPGSPSDMDDVNNQMKNIFGQPVNKYGPVSSPSPYPKQLNVNYDDMPAGQNPPLLSSMSTSQMFTGSLVNEQTIEGEPMDWSPSISQVSQHRAFLPSSRDLNSKLFGDSPVNGQNSAFWYKVPPAPTTPAQRRYNPPNKARLQVTPQETKENFFNSMNRRVRDSNFGVSGLNMGDNINSVDDFEFAQPKFFPPTSPCKETDELIQLFTNSWTLSEEEKKIPELVRRHGSRSRNGLHALLLICGFVLWHYSEKFPSTYSRQYMTVVMISAFYVGEEIIRDNHTNIKRSTGSHMSQIVGIIIGTSALIGAGLTIVNIWYENSSCTNLASHGHWLVAALCLHQFWLALFGH